MGRMQVCLHHTIRKGAAAMLLHSMIICGLLFLLELHLNTMECCSSYWCKSSSARERRIETYQTRTGSDSDFIIGEATKP